MHCRSTLRWFGVLAGLAVASCGQLIAEYSQQAYKNDTTLKADVAAVVAQSATPYGQHGSDINALTLKLNEAYEFSRGEAYNQLSTKEWELLLNPDGDLYGKFLKEWKAKGSFSTTEADNWKVLLDRAFDYMICLEANKQSATACHAPEAVRAG
jgi:hypothetical protein